MPARHADALTSPTPDARRSRWATPALGAAGLTLLIYLVVRLSPAVIAAHLQGLAAILPLVLLITSAKYPLQAAGWRLALPPEQRPPWGESISATITGDALGYLTWAGPVSGEPLRAHLIRRSVPIATGIAAGAAERAIYNATAAVLIWTALLSLLADGRMLGAVLLSSAAGAAGVTVAMRRHARRQPAADSQPSPPSAAPAVAQPPARGIRAVRAALGDIWRDRRGALPAIALLCVVQHAVLVGEAYVMLAGLGPITFQGALIFEAVTKIVNVVGMIVPGRLGVAEGGSALLAGALGLAASHGLSLALMRRVRALIWAAVGLVLLPIQEARARPRPEAAGGYSASRGVVPNDTNASSG
jgi:hypothetical protein